MTSLFANRRKPKKVGREADVPATEEEGMCQPVLSGKSSNISKSA